MKRLILILMVATSAIASDKVTQERMFFAGCIRAVDGAYGKDGDSSVLCTIILDKHKADIPDMKDPFGCGCWQGSMNAEKVLGVDARVLARKNCT